MPFNTPPAPPPSNRGARHVSTVVRSVRGYVRFHEGPRRPLGASVTRSVLVPGSPAWCVWPDLTTVHRGTAGLARAPGSYGTAAFCLPSGCAFLWGRGLVPGLPRVGLLPWHFLWSLWVHPSQAVSVLTAPVPVNCRNDCPRRPLLLSHSVPPEATATAPSRWTQGTLGQEGLLGVPVLLPVASFISFTLREPLRFAEDLSAAHKPLRLPSSAASDSLTPAGHFGWTKDTVLRVFPGFVTWKVLLRLLWPPRFLLRRSLPSAPSSLGARCRLSLPAFHVLAAAKISAFLHVSWCGLR